MKTKRTKPDPKTIRLLREWLAVDGNTEEKLAQALSYAGRSVVSQWLRRGRVPEHQRMKIIRFIEGGQNV